MGGLPSTKKGKLPSSLPKTVTKPKGLPSTSKPQYAIPEGQIDELIAANEELIADKSLAQGAIDFDALCDDHAELECLVPPDPKPTNPLEAAVDKDVAREKIPPVEITLLMLDTADDIYYDLVDEQALIPDDRNGKKPSSYWDLGKKIEKQKQHMISIGRRWRAQQDALLRDVMEKLTQALLINKTM